MAKAAGAPAGELVLAALSGPARGDDDAVALLELLAYVADVLASYQDEVADEAELDSTWDARASVLQIRFGARSQLPLCVVADDRRVYVVAVSSDTGEACVSFGDGAVGKRPGSAAGRVKATYKRGAGAGGDLVLSGLHLVEPFVVIASSGRSENGRRVSCIRRL